MTEDEYIEPELPTAEGAKPVLVYEPSHLQEKRDVQDLLKQIRKEQPDMTVAVLVRDYIIKSKVGKWLREAGLEYQEIKKGYSYKVLTPGIKMVTYFLPKAWNSISSFYRFWITGFSLIYMMSQRQIKTRIPLMIL